MMSNLGTLRASSRALDLARAYDGEVPPPFYWSAPYMPLRQAARHHAGEIETTLPYPAVPAAFLSASAVSLEWLDELMERRARREELLGG